MILNHIIILSEFLAVRVKLYKNASAKVDFNLFFLITISFNSTLDLMFVIENYNVFILKRCICVVSLRGLCLTFQNTFLFFFSML